MKPVYSLILGASALALLSACAQDMSPGPLNRDKVLYLRGDGWAMQRYEQCPQPAWHDRMQDGERHAWHRHHHHHAMKKTTAAAAKDDVKKDAPKKDDAKKDDVKKDEPKKDGTSNW